MKANLFSTPVIRYNLTDRGRQFRGKERNYNIPALVSAINSAACQEKVKNRDMLGFYGHWPRVKFGLSASEGGLDKGRPAFVEPAIVTTFLKAYSDGTVEHQEEFLDTPSGKLAERLFKSSVGGFSSVIGEEFFGFDYVNEPNYTQNRGYALDSCDLTEDQIEAAIMNESIAGVLMLFEGIEQQVKLQNETIEALKLENAQLVDNLAARQAREKAYMDAIAPQLVDRRPADALMDDVRSFWGCKHLPRLQDPHPKKELELDVVSERLLSRF